MRPSSENKDGERPRLMLLAVLLGMLTMLMLAWLPLMAWWPDKPDWPLALTAIAYSLPVAMASVPFACFLILVKRMRQQTKRDLGIEDGLDKDPAQ